MPSYTSEFREFVARLDTKEKVVLHLPEGEHLLRVGGDLKGRGV